MMHIGQGLVCGTKIKELVKAGFHFIIFLADYHAMINNKYGGDLDKIKTAGEYFRHCFIALGIPEHSVEYIWASSLASRKEYWERVLRVASTITTKRVLRALPIMGRDMESQDTEAAAIFYPCMQAADIFEMKLDVACAGIDQRKAHILARESGEKLAWGKPVCVHTPILMGLHGTGKVENGRYDEDSKLNEVIAAKMSKSKPEDNILIHDDPSVIARKIDQAYCPARISEGNPILEYYRMIVFPEQGKLMLGREARYGGNVEASSYDQLEGLYRDGKVHPKDLKTNISRILSERLEPVREYFRKNPKPIEDIRKLTGR